MAAKNISTHPLKSITTVQGHFLPAQPLPVPGREYVKAGDGGVVSSGDIAALEAHLLEGEAKGHQVGTHSQEELQQEAAKEVVLSLRQEDKEPVRGCSIHNGLAADLHEKNGNNTHRVAILSLNRDFRERTLQCRHVPEGRNNAFLVCDPPTFLGIASKFFPVATLMTELSGGFPRRETLFRQSNGQFERQGEKVGERLYE